MQNKIENLIDRLADKTLSFGCEFEWVDEDYNEVNYRIVNVTEFEDIFTERSSFELQAYKIKDIHKELFSFDEYDEDTEQSFYDIAKILGHPILIGDVLNKLDEIGTINTEVLNYGIETPYGQIHCGEYLNLLWQSCGFTKSLQEIVAESGYTKRYSTLKPGKEQEYILKDPSARALFDYLLEIFN
jgi:hypothetical protein